MISANLLAVFYLISGVLFILALRGLSSPETSRRGNLFGIIGMTIAIGVTVVSVGNFSTGFLYLLISLVACLLYYFLYFDLFIFNLVILSIISLDIGSYFFGSIFGKKKIFPKISPNKTKEGLIFGLLFSNFLSILYIILFNNLSLINIILTTY